MPVVLERWNDDKMDGLSEKVDGLGGQVREQRQEMREWRQEMKAGFDRIDAKFERVDDRFYELQKETKEGFEAMHRTMNRNVIAICGVFIAALVALAGLMG